MARYYKCFVCEEKKHDEEFSLRGEPSYGEKEICDICLREAGLREILIAIKEYINDK